MSQNLSILSKKMAMILSVSASTGKAGVRLRGGNTGAFLWDRDFDFCRLSVLSESGGLS